MRTRTLFTLCGFIALSALVSNDSKLFGGLVPTPWGARPAQASTTPISILIPDGGGLDAVVGHPDSSIIAGAAGAHGGTGSAAGGVPGGARLLPAVVLAPGKGYDKERPLIREIFDYAVAHGLVAVRFDYRYFTERRSPSASLNEETADLEAAVAFLRHDPQVDTSRIIVIGKSLGSVVAHRVFRAQSSLYAEVLLTPIIARKGEADVYYPDLAALNRAVVIVLGSQDEGNCPLPNLYDALKDSRGNVAVVVLGGDHAFGLGDPAEPGMEARNARNLAQAVAITGHWLDLLTGR
jgi:dienelactone hydrolase